MFGQVYLAREGEKYYACKIMNKQTIQNKDAMDKLKNEVKVLQKTKQSDCDHIIKLVEMAETPTNFYMMMELCNGGDLYHLL